MVFMITEGDIIFFLVYIVFIILWYTSIFNIQGENEMIQ